MLDGHLDEPRHDGLADGCAAFAPGDDRGHHRADLPVLALRPARAARAARVLLALAGRGRTRLVAVGPHGSATPDAALRKLGVDCVVRGECEEVVAALADARRRRRRARHRFRDAALRATGGAAGRALHRPAGAALAGPLGRAPPPSPPPLRPRNARPDAGRRGRGLARLPLPLLVLRQDRLPRRLPPARPRAACWTRSTG